MFDINTRKVDQTYEAVSLNNGESFEERQSALSIRRTYYTGLSGSLGIEYFLKKNIGLSLEFQSNIGYSYYKSETKTKVDNDDLPDQESKSANDETRHSLSYNSNNVKVGISIYF